MCLNQFQLKSSFLLLFSILSLFGVAQQSVKGRIVSPGNEPVSNVTIAVKGTNKTVTTDAAGHYNIEASANDILLISSVGYETKEVKASEAATVALKNDAKNLSEVIVTALGIRREEKSLGYAAQTVKGNAVKDAKTNNWINSLSGKVAGLNIQGAGAGPMGFFTDHLKRRIIFEPG
jgi:hypothetical protein